jgi:glycosyltransferase involved in cell wall biosynthesis
VLVVVTPVKNEPKMLLSIAKQLVSQTLTPKLWIIVDDGSTDETKNVIIELERRYKFILGIHMKETEGYDEVFRYGRLVRTGFNYAAGMNEVRFLGVLDVDMEFGKNYYEEILNTFERVPKLGVASGLYYESDNASSKVNLKSSICGATMVFRKECLLNIEGYPTCPRPDTVALLKAVNRGWWIGVLSSTYEIHLKANRSLNKYLKIGSASYMLGYHPLNALVSGPFEALKTFSLSPLGLTAGYILGALRASEIEDRETLTYFHESFLRRTYEAIAILSGRRKVRLDPIKNALMWF